MRYGFLTLPQDIGGSLFVGLVVGFDTETTLAEDEKNFVRVVSNNDDLEACLIATIQSRVRGLTVTRDLFDRPTGPYVELIALCEPRKPLIRDRAGRPIATQSLLVCATTVNAFPGGEFWATLGIDRAGDRRLTGPAHVGLCIGRHPDRAVRGNRP